MRTTERPMITIEIIRDYRHGEPEGDESCLHEWQVYDHRGNQVAVGIVHSSDPNQALRLAVEHAATHYLGCMPARVIIEDAVELWSGTVQRLMAWTSLVPATISTERVL